MQRERMLPDGKHVGSKTPPPRSSPSSSKELPLTTRIVINGSSRKEQNLKIGLLHKSSWHYEKACRAPRLGSSFIVGMDSLAEVGTG